MSDATAPEADGCPACGCPTQCAEGVAHRLREAIADEKDYQYRTRRYLILNGDGAFMWAEELMDGDLLVADRPTPES